MGSLLSTAWLFRRNDERSEDLKKLKARGGFKLSLSPSVEEISSNHDDMSPSLSSNKEDEEMDESLVNGRQLRGSPRGWVYDEAKSGLENRRPVFHHGLFG